MTTVVDQPELYGNILRLHTYVMYWGLTLYLYIVLGSKPAAERHLKEFYQEMILTNYCVVKEEEGIPLRAAIRQYFDIAAAVLDLQ